MRLRDAVVKQSFGRSFLHRLSSTYYVELNDRALEEIERSLSNPEAVGPGRALVDRLARQGLVEEGEFVALPRRAGSDLVSLELEPVGRCNLDCKHCFVRFTDATLGEEAFAAVLKGAVALGAVELTFNGGEPLLHPRCLDWIDQVRAQGIRVLLFTNGILITERIAERLAQAGVARVTVSLDGFEAAHDAMRGAGSFARTTRGIERLVKAGLSVFTTTMAHPGNHEELEELRRFCLDQLGVAGVRVSTIAPLGRAAAEQQLQLSPERFTALYRNDREGGGGGGGSDRSGLLPCRAGADKLYVSAEGRVHACHLYEPLEAALGIVPAEPLEQIYRSVQARSYGAALHGFALQKLIACQDCPHLRTCRGGCRARAQALTGDPYGPDPVSCQKHGRTPTSTHLGPPPAVLISGSRGALQVQHAAKTTLIAGSTTIKT